MKKNADGEIIGVDYRQAAARFMAAASARGPWSPAGKLRGRGSWSESDGELLIHLGTTVIAGGQSRQPGVFGEHVLPARPPVMGPALEFRAQR